MSEKDAPQAQGDKPNGVHNSMSENYQGDVLMGEELSMNRIVDFLRDQQRMNYSRETEFLFEKQQMQTKITQLSAQLKAQENINGDLIKRIKMLEFSLRQERIKYAKLAEKNNFDVGSTDIIGQVLQKANLNTNLYERVAKRRAKAQRPLLLKFLQEIGYDDIFNVDEVNEIKALYDKAQEEMKENFENEINGGGLSYAQKLEEKMLSKEQEKESQQQVQQPKDQKDDIYRDVEIVDGQAAILKESREEVKGDVGVGSKFIKAKYNVRAHFDAVRSMHYSQSIQILATASEDCQIKLWNMKNIQKEYQNTNQFLEPFATLRGHTGPIFTITGPNNSDNAKTGRLVFTGGSEGVIRAWNIPLLHKDEQYPTTNGKSFCVGIWSDGIAEPVWQLQYHPFTDYLLSIKSDNVIQVWDCNEIAKQAENYDETKFSSANINKNDQPFKEYVFEVDGKQPIATCCTWLPSDTNLFAVGFDSCQVAIFDYQSGMLQSAEEFKDVSSPISYIVAHEMQSVIVIGHQNGAITFYDFSKKVTIGKIEAQSEEACVQSMTFLNHCLSLAVGYSDGNIKIYDAKNYKLLSIVQNAHLQKYDEAVNHLLYLQPQGGTNSQDPQNQDSALPFFLSAGADSMIKFYEHNPYIVKSDDDSKSNAKQLKPPTEQYEQLSKTKNKSNVNEHIKIVREAFEKTGDHKRVFGDKYASTILDGLLEFKEGSNSDTKYDLKKLATDQQYLWNSALLETEAIKTKIIKQSIEPSEKQSIEKVVDQLWDTHDVDKKGVLDKEQTKKFVNDAMGKLSSGERVEQDAIEDVFTIFNKNGTVEKAEMVFFIKQLLGGEQ